MENFHHVHLFASNIEAALKFYGECLDAKVVLDMDLAGARNVFVRLGGGRIHFYDQPPKDGGRGAVHHLGIQTTDLEGLVARMKAYGVEFRKEIADFGFWKYVMAPAPDDVLLELFEVNGENLPDNMKGYFSFPEVISGP